MPQCMACAVLHGAPKLMYIYIYIYRTHAHAHTHTHAQTCTYLYAAIASYSLLHHHHDTVQVAMHTHMCLCTSVNGLVGIEKTPPVQVAGGHHTGASEAMYGEAKYIFALIAF